jgi:hypothetical protein
MFKLSCGISGFKMGVDWVEVFLRTRLSSVLRVGSRFSIEIDVLLATRGDLRVMLFLCIIVELVLPRLVRRPWKVE